MIAVVTGGGSGIGSAVTDRLRNAGADVVAWDLDGGDIDCDISDPDAVSAAIDRRSPTTGHPTDWSPAPASARPGCCSSRHPPTGSGSSTPI